MSQSRLFSGFFQQERKSYKQEYERTVAIPFIFRIFSTRHPEWGTEDKYESRNPVYFQDFFNSFKEVHVMDERVVAIPFIFRIFSTAGKLFSYINTLTSFFNGL